MDIQKKMEIEYAPKDYVLIGDALNFIIAMRVCFFDSHQNSTQKLVSKILTSQISLTIMDPFHQENSILYIATNAVYIQGNHLTSSEKN